MESSYARFLDGVHAEHIDEAAFLFEQVLNLSDTDQLPWPVLGSFEARFEAHLDALVLGGDRAWRLCCTHVDRQTVGVLHVCLALACRARQAGRVAQVLRDAELSQPELVRAATLALARELPPDWHVFVEQGLGRRDRLLPVLAAVAGQRRLPCLPALLAAMPLAPPDALPALLRALGQLADPAALPAVRARLAGDVPEVRAAALLAALRLGAKETLALPTASSWTETWAVRTMAVGGDASTVAVLLRSVAEGRAIGECLWALGQLGDPAALPALVGHLGSSEYAIDAARALERITGAGLVETAFVPERVDVAELFDDELVAWRERGATPVRGDGRPYGETVEQVVVDQAAWRAWLSHHASRLVPGRRFRRGQLCGPLTLVAALADPRARKSDRAADAEELSLRYGCVEPFDTDMPVRAQQRAIAGMQAWAGGADARFPGGGWCYAGSGP